MDEETYRELSDKQLAIEETVLKEFNNFKKNNSERRKIVADDLWLKIRGLKLKFERTHEVLYNHLSELKTRSYFVLNVRKRCDELFTKFLELLKEYISTDIPTSGPNSLESEKGTGDEKKEDEKLQNDNQEQGPEEVVQNPPNQEMAGTLEDIVRQLADMQVQRNEQSPGEVIKNCSNIIIKFDKSNISNFLSSVDMALTMADENNKALVLKYAQQRVNGSALIESKKYEDFNIFKEDVLNVFKPKRTVTEIESAIARLMQEQKESVDDYGKRVFQLKSEYELATRAERAVKKAELDAVRLEEMEAKISTAFINGLKDHVLRFVAKRPATLSEAISSSLEAESTSSLRYQNRKQFEREKDEDKNHSKDNDFKEKPFTGDEINKKNWDKQKNEESVDPPTCYYCDQVGHIKRFCPKLKKQESEECQPSTSAMVAKTDTNQKNSKACGAATQEPAVTARSLKIKSFR